MRTSASTKELATAFIAAQAELKNTLKDGLNPHFKNKYATLGNVRDSVTPVLAKHGLAVLQGADFVDGNTFITTRLMHKSGEWIESAYPFPLAKPQEMGSAMTYARRYSLSAICGIASDDDDDGNAAQAAQPIVMAASNGSKDASKTTSRPEFDAMVKIIRNSHGKKALEDWYANSFRDIEALPEEWLDELRIEYKDKLSELKKELAL